MSMLRKFQIYTIYDCSPKLLALCDRRIREEEVMSVPSWHQVDPGPVSPDTTTSHAPGQVPRPLAPPPPVMTACGLCPEPGLVPARHLTDHLDREHPGRAFRCAACKVSFLH